MERVFDLDRPVDSTTAILWLAATGAGEVRFDTVSETTRNQASDEGGRVVHCFTDRLVRTNDLLYAVRFSVPVKKFRLWIEAESPLGEFGLCEAKVERRTMVDLGESAITKVEFDQGLPLNIYTCTCRTNSSREP